MDVGRLFCGWREGEREGEGGREREREGGRERGRERGREGEREGGREGEREREREGGSEGVKEREGERERGREGEREGGRERGREGERKGGREKSSPFHQQTPCYSVRALALISLDELTNLLRANPEFSITPQGNNAQCTDFSKLLQECVFMLW